MQHQFYPAQNTAHFNGQNGGQHRGFTLIELMVTVAIIAVLSAVALPSYREYVNRQKRADAQTQLVAAQMWKERFYATNLRYDQDSGGTAVTTAFNNQPFKSSPQSGSGAAEYTVSVNAQRNTYTLTATRTGTMASDSCGNFTLTNTGVRDLVSEATGKTLADCWK